MYRLGHHSSLRHSGFTIVELLVVIVIIGMLAAVTVVVFNGVQDRATATRAAQVANSYAKAFEVYYNTCGTYPDISPLKDGSLTNYCLGTTTDYPANSDFEAGQCGVSTDDDITKVYASAAFNTEIQKVTAVSGSPALPTAPNPWGLAIKYRGIQVQTAKQSGKWWTSFRWELKGKQSCGAGGSSTQAYYDDSTNVTRCVTMLHYHYD